MLGSPRCLSSFTSNLRSASKPPVSKARHAPLKFQIKLFEAFMKAPSVLPQSSENMKNMRDNEVSAYTRVTPSPAQTLSEEVKYTQRRECSLWVIVHLPQCLASYPPAPHCSFLTSHSTSPLIPCSPTFYQIQSPKQDWTSEMQLRSRSSRKHCQSRWPSLPFKGTAALSDGPVLGGDPVSGRTSVKAARPWLPWATTSFHILLKPASVHGTWQPMAGGWMPAQVKEVPGCALSQRWEARERWQS